MTNKIVSASLALLLGWSGTAIAQSEFDALRYTRLGLSGSARIQGMGGANAALGADISSLSTNPAGLGLFRRSEFTISPGFSAANAQTSITNSGSYSGSSVSDGQNSINIPQAGIVLSDRKGDDDGSDWRGTTFGVSISRLNNFNTRTSYRGNTSATARSIADFFAEQATNNRRTYEDLESEYDNFYSLEGMAYGTYLIDIVRNDQEQILLNSIGGDSIAAAPRFGQIGFGEDVLRRGSQSQFDFGLGTNFRDKLYLGASIGIVSTNFTQERIFRESEADDRTEFTSLELRDEVRSRGGGINLKVGAIYRFSDTFRGGVSVQTPTLYTFDETYDTFLHTTYSDIGRVSVSQMPGQFSYTLVTPFRATGGLAYFFSKHGFLTADVEYVNYSNARFRERDRDFGSSGNFFSNLNDRIASTYQSAVNLRLGAEARYEVFRFRAGYARTGDPYQSADLNGGINTITLGAGMRFQNFYIDAAYARSINDNRYIPYSFNAGPSPEVAITDRLTNVMFTAGFNF